MGVEQQAPHAPKLGVSTRLLGKFHVTGIFWYRFHHWGVGILPRWGRSIFLFLFNGFFFLVLRRIRRAVASNLVPVLGPCGWWEKQHRIYRTLNTFAWSLTERYEQFSAGERVDVRVDPPEIWQSLRESSRGAILVTGHIGNWEIGSMKPASTERRRIHVVREEEVDPRAQEFIRGLLCKHMGDSYVTHFEKNDPFLGVQLLDVLGQGDVVALQGDRPRKGGRTIQVRLFDKPYEVPVGPLALARAAEVPLVPVFVLREGRFRYRAAFREPIHVSRSGNRDVDMREAAQRFVAELEWAIRECPHQWFCFRNLWEERRGGTRALASGPRKRVSPAPR